jgi:hypothetical protein
MRGIPSSSSRRSKRYVPKNTLRKMSSDQRSPTTSIERAIEQVWVS